MLVAGAAYRLGHLDADEGQFDRAARILAGCGAAVLYRRDVFDMAGALDLDFFAYLDDHDLGLRAQLLGYSGLYLPEAVAYHIGSATLGEALHPRVMEYITRNQLWLLVKDYPRGALRSLLPRIIFYQCAWLVLCLRRHGLLPYLRGLMAALRGLPAMRQKHAHLMSIRKAGDAEFLSRLRDSERQVYDWVQSQPPANRSALLKLYFRVFGAP